MPDYQVDPEPAPYSTQPRSRPLRSQSYDLPPSGPMRRWHKRHFAHQEGLGLLIMLTIVGVAVYFVGWDWGFWG